MPRQALDPPDPNQRNVLILRSRSLYELLVVRAVAVLAQTPQTRHRDEPGE